MSGRCCAWDFLQEGYTCKGVLYSVVGYALAIGPSTYNEPGLALRVNLAKFAQSP